MSLSAISKPLRAAVFRRDAGRCLYCHVMQVGQSAVFHVDHVIPRSRGGSTTAENLVLQCPHCSLRKADKTHAMDPATSRTIALFHPLIDDWPEHFSLQHDGTLVGRSPAGRATVASLHVNDVWPRSARALQIAAGWLDASPE